MDRLAECVNGILCGLKCELEFILLVECIGRVCKYTVRTAIGNCDNCVMEYNICSALVCCALSAG
jgi:hypothetical protein